MVDIPEAALRIGKSEAMVRHLIREGRITAERAGRGSRSPYRIDVEELERWYASENEGVVFGRNGAVMGRGEGQEAAVALAGAMKVRYGVTAGASASEYLDRRALLEQAAAAVEESRAELGLEFDDLDDEDAIEREAQAIAARARRAERVRRRANAIIDEQDQD